MATRKRPLRRNSTTDTPRPRIGYLPDDHGQPTQKQPRFNLGDDQLEADYRYALIRRLYEENCIQIGCDCWSPLALGYAKGVAGGMYEFSLRVPSNLLEDDSRTRDEIAAGYVQFIRLQQEWFPTLKFIPSDSEFYYSGIMANRRIESDQLQVLYGKLSNFGIVPANTEVPQKIVPGTFHDAFDGYVRHIEKTGNKLEGGILKLSQRKRIQIAKSIKERHADRPLHSLTFDSIAEIIAYWTNRPMTKRGKVCKPKWAHDVISEFDRFLNWLDVTPSFEWEKPKGVDQISRKITDLEQDHAGNGVITKKVYSPEQLGLIYQHANDLDRTLLLVGVNCAFGAAEVGRLTISEILFDHSHEYAERLNFSTTSADSFVRFNRPKSKMFGEWLLWPETADQLRWSVSRAKRLGSNFICVRETGNILYDEKLKNPQAPFAKRWSDLLNRVAKVHPGFPRLPFGTLRDTMPDRLRHRYSDELASIALAHKTAFKPDNLLEAYGNKPFGRLHTAIRELRDYFAPMLSPRKSN